MELTKEIAGGTNARTVQTGVIAGLLGGITVELFLLVVGAASWPATYQWIASGIAGKAAFASLADAWLGLAIHGVVSISWGIAYAVSARRIAALRDTPALSGLLFGLIAFVAMQAVTFMAGIWSAPTPLQLGLYLVDHTVFFGLPVAFYVSSAFGRR